MSFYNYFNYINPNYRNILFSLKLWSKNLPNINLDLPMLDRFRDVFYNDGNIKLYCRIGGNNREKYKKEILTAMENPYYVKNYDYKNCSTYIVFEYKKQILVPNYYRDIFFDINKAINDIEKAAVLTSILNKVVNGDKLSIKEMLQNPHIIKKGDIGNNYKIEMIDREDIINVIEAQTNYEKILNKYNSGGFIVHNGN